MSIDEWFQIVDLISAARISFPSAMKSQRIETRPIGAAIRFGCVRAEHRLLLWTFLDEPPLLAFQPNYVIYVSMINNIINIY